jgi:hypothetical protein
MMVVFLVLGAVLFAGGVVLLMHAILSSPDSKEEAETTGPGGMEEVEAETNEPPPDAEAWTWIDQEGLRATSDDDGDDAESASDGDDVDVDQRSTPVSVVRTIDPFTGEELGTEQQWVIVVDEAGSAIQICTNWGTWEIFEDPTNRAWVANRLRCALGSCTDHILFEDRVSRKSGPGSDFADRLLGRQDVEGVLDQLFVRPGMFASGPNIYHSFGGQPSTLADLADLADMTEEELGQEVGRSFEAIAIDEPLDTTPSPDEATPSAVGGEEARVEIYSRAMRDTGTAILFALPTSAPSVTADHDEESVSASDDVSLGDGQENVGVPEEAPPEPIAPPVPAHIESNVEQVLVVMSSGKLDELTEQVIARAREEALRLADLEPLDITSPDNTGSSAVNDPPELPSGFDPNDF